MGFVVPLAHARALDRFGGKAAQLAALMAVPQVRVPDGFAISREVFRETLAANLPRGQWPERLVQGPASERRGDRLAAIRARLEGGTLPPAHRQRIVDAYATLGRGVVAVRSSALHEDSDGATAAGLQETRLGVEGDDDVVRSVLACFASIYRERALAYLARLGGVKEISLAVLVQRLVASDVAGVLFTEDPVRHDPTVMLVEAARGMGAAVVDGTISPDVYRIDHDTGVARSTTTGRQREAVSLREGQLVREPVRDITPVLDAARLTELATLGRVVERASMGPRDIEWSYAGDTLWVLQSRPIVGSAHKGDDRSTWVWSNLNVGEALPGVATPLTWSIGAAFSELGFRRAFGALGCTVPHDAELVGQFHGRIYLNLTLFMRIASQVPLLDPKVLLEFGGGGGLELLERQVAPGTWPRFLVRAPWAGVRYVAENVGLNRRLQRFEQDFVAARSTFEATDLPSLSPLALAEVLTGLEALLDRTGAMMLTCASGSLSSIVALRALLKVFCKADATRLERELLTGIADLESALPGIALVHLAELARREPAARDVLDAHPAADLSVAMLPEGGPTRRAFASFLRAYGYRCTREAELAIPRWREAPQVLFAAIKAQLERADTAALARVDRQVAARADAERELESHLPAPARSIARHLLARTRRFVRLRERMRARVTEVLGFFRRVALEADVRLQRGDRATGREGVFHLHLDELQSFLRGELVDVEALVSARRADFARDEARPDPPPVFVGSPPPFVPPVVPAGDRVVGIGASPGCVIGAVRVLRDAAEGGRLRPGEVLVVPVADVGWTPLFLVAAAVITELGGALSHASLVAREYGVPAVVNVSGATRLLVTGDTVRVDGDRGVIDILTRAERRESP